MSRLKRGVLSRLEWVGSELRVRQAAGWSGAQVGGNGKKVDQLVVGQPCFVGDARFELATSSVSGKRATTAPTARGGDGI